MPPEVASLAMISVFGKTRLRRPAARLRTIFPIRMEQFPTGPGWTATGSGEPQRGVDVAPDGNISVYDRACRTSQTQRWDRVAIQRNCTARKLARGI